MPKRFHHLYDRIYSFEHLFAAYHRARRGKRRRPDVATFEFRYEEELLQLGEELREGRYQPGIYHRFRTTENGKRRVISAAPFRDRVVHHALCALIEPIWEARFIHDSYASRPGKGTHAAIKRAQQFARGHRYALPLDVVEFFPSADHQVVRGLLAHHLRDDRILDLIDRILTGGAHELRDAYTPVYFPGDDLFALIRSRGLPIGNQTSQFWANVLLHPLDMFIKQELGCKAYLRYCDDLLLFADAKPILWQWRERIIAFAATTLRLTFHPDRAQVVPVTTGLPFLGWRIAPYRRKLKRRNLLAFARRFRRMRSRYADGRCTLAELDTCIQGWIGHVRHGHTVSLRRSLLNKPLPKRGMQR